MIQTVVFDLAGVMIKSSFDLFLSHCVPLEMDRAPIRRELFGSVEWIMLDRGTISRDDVAKAACTRLPARLHPFVWDVMAQWHTDSVPMPGMEALVRRIKAAGYGVYLLSNTALSFHSHHEILPASDCFDGTFVSAECRLLKPEREIYEAFLSKFDLRAEDCVFLDDTPCNVEAAIRLGFSGVLFHGADAAASALAALGLRF